MSRRRRNPAPPVRGLRVVCTDRGQHPERTLGTLNYREPTTVGDLRAYADMVRALTPDGPAPDVPDGPDDLVVTPGGVTYENRRTRVERSGKQVTSSRGGVVAKGRPDGGRTFEFTCADCRPPRHPELREEKVADLYAALAAIGVARLDISALPV